MDEDKKIANIKKIDLLEKSNLQGIYLRPVWRLLHKLPMYKNNPRGDLSFSEDQESRIVSLPSSPQLILNHSWILFMKNNSIVIVGCGGHSKSIIDLINITGQFNIIGLVGKNDAGKNV